MAQFLTRLCAGVGGLAATSKLICGLVDAAIKAYCCNKILPSPGKKRSNVVETADLLLPGERTQKTPAAAAAAAAAAAGSPSSTSPASMASQPQPNSAAVTLQEVEKLIKS